MHANVRSSTWTSRPTSEGAAPCYLLPSPTHAPGRETASAQVGPGPAPSGGLTCDGGEAGTASLSELSFRNLKTIWFGL